MNKFKFSVIAMIVAILPILMTSCHKDDDKTPINNESIIGVWTLISYEISNFENSGQIQDDFEDIYPRPTVEFKANGKCNIVIEEDETLHFDYVISVNKIFFDNPIAFDHSSFSFILTSNTLTLTRSDTFDGHLGNYTENTTVILTK